MLVGCQLPLPLDSSHICMTAFETCCAMGGCRSGHSLAFSRAKVGQSSTSPLPTSWLAEVASNRQKTATVGRQPCTLGLLARRAEMQASQVGRAEASRRWPWALGLQAPRDPEVSRGRWGAAEAGDAGAGWGVGSFPSPGLRLLSVYCALRVCVENSESLPLSHTAGSEKIHEQVIIIKCKSHYYRRKE